MSGCRRWAAWQVALALGTSAREGLARFELIQPMYNLARRQAEVEILPLALAALSLEMTPELRSAVAALSPAPPPANDRTETLKPGRA